MILIGGENLIDYIQEPGHPGYPMYRAVPGGSPYNVAKAVARQDAPTGYLTPFSSDSLGRLMRDELASDGVAMLGGTSSKPTSLAVVSLEDGQASYQFYREATAERDVDFDRLLAAVPPQAQAFHIGSLALTHGADADAWEALFVALKKRGLFCAIDPNIRAAFIHDRDTYLARLERLYALADLIKFSDEDLRWLAGGEDLMAAQQAIFDRAGAGLVVLTLGSEGARAICAQGTVSVPPAPITDLADTVGAGDTFMGTLLAECRARGHYDGIDGIGLDAARDLLQVAARAAAINCTRLGCNPPTAEELYPV